MSDGGLKLLRATLEYSLTLPRPAHRADVSAQRRHGAAHKARVSFETFYREKDAAQDATGCVWHGDEVYEELS